MDFPQDKSTVFSIAPTPLKEFKPGLYPGTFTIEPCLNYKEPKRIVVGSSVYTVHVGGRKEPLRVVTPSYIVAKSIVDDFIDGQLYIGENEKPGICWIQGDVDTTVFMTQSEVLYKQMQQWQKNWFVRLCRETDNLWHKYKHPRVVTDQARFAAVFLGIPTPDWMNTEIVAENFLKCPACGTMNDNQNIVCSGCTALLTKELFAAKTRDEKMAALKFAASK